MIQLSTFLGNIQKIVDAHPSYELGQDGSRGSCDCIGLIIGAVRRSGEKWPGTHGSNWTARNRMTTFQSPAPLELGGIVYKAHEPGAIANDLPEAYKGHTDQRDYYHVGVITSVSPLRITHCTGGTTNGIKIDTKIGAWRYGGRLDGLDYKSKEETPPMDLLTAIVTAESGKSVRMRASPSLQAITRANVPLGSTVEVLQKDTDWWEIRYGSIQGWMLAQFLSGNFENNAPVIVNADVVKVVIDRALAEKLAAALAESIREKST